MKKPQLNPYTRDYGVHFNPELDLKLKQLAQREFIKVYGYTRWMKEFNRDYCGE
jgi:hypothetical protein